MDSKSLWVRSQGGSEPPSDLPDGRYELRFTVSQTVRTAAIGAFWQNKANTLRIRPAVGQVFAPVSIYEDKDQATGLTDLVLLVDLEGFLVQFMTVCLGLIGLGIVAWLTVREIRQVLESTGGQILAAGTGLVLVLLVIVASFYLVKTKGAVLPPVKTG